MRFGVVVLVSLIAVDPWGWDRFGPLRFGLLSAIGFGVIAAALIGHGPRPAWWPTWARLGWGLLLAGLLAGIAFSDDRWHALVGTPDRHLGLVVWLLSAGLFWAAGSSSESSRVPVAIAATAGTALVGVYTLLELGGIDALDIGFSGDRMGGPFGQPAYLGAAMALTVPIVIGATGSSIGGRRVASAVWIAGGLGLFALGASQARAAVIGLLVAFAVVAASRRTEIDRIRSGLVAAVAAALVAAAALTPLGDRLWALSDLDDGVVAGRLDEWQVGADAFVHADAGGLIGYGPEGYRIVFGEFVDQQYVIDHGRTAITDRAHNSLLDTALTGGWAAGGGLAVLHGGVVVAAWRALRQGDRLDAGMGAGAIAYATQQLFLFPLAELDPAFWVVGGLLVARTAGDVPPGWELPTAVARPLGATALAIAIVAAGAGVLDLAADHRVDTAQKRGDAAIAGDAADLRPDSIRYAFIASRLAPDHDAALAHLADGLDVSPLDPALRAEQASVLLDRARLTDREDHLREALDALEMLGRDDPNHPESQLRLGVARALGGDDAGAVAALTHAATLAPSSSEPLINLAVVHLGAERYEEARFSVERAQVVDPDDPRLLLLLSEISAAAAASTD